MTAQLLLLILDGFGYSPEETGNAILQAKTPNLDYLWSKYDHYLLKAAEEEVGLGFGEVGNSEVGHMTIGTGRVIPQSLNRIDKAIDEGSFSKNQAFQDTFDQVKSTNSALHLMGIISTAGVHGHLFHLLKILDLAHQANVPKIYLHLITDGRDAGKFDSQMFLKDLDAAKNRIPAAEYATVIGRAFAMDRNQNWDKTKQAYQAIIGQGNKTNSDPLTIIQSGYDQGLDDESIQPTIVSQSYPGLQEGDCLIFTNFREDRARQITKALILDEFDHFNRSFKLPANHMCTMVSYEKDLPVRVAFPPPEINQTLSDVVSANGLSQIHIAESEKYAHVTYFFNGGRESKALYEEFHLVPSLKPEEFAANPNMSAEQITQAINQSLDLGYNLIVANFANPDMVGHTGDFQATIRAVEFVDQKIGEIWKQCQQRGSNMLITADHGNCENMLANNQQEILKNHTISPVPFIIAGNDNFQDNQITKVMSDGQLAGLLSDIAPTSLKLLNLEIPAEMTGNSLF